MKDISNRMKVFAFIAIIMFSFMITVKANSCSILIENHGIPTKTKDYYLEFQDMEFNLIEHFISPENFKDLLIKAVFSEEKGESILKDFYVADENTNCKVSIHSRTERRKNKIRQLAASLNCNYSTYYSAMFGMNLPTGSSLTVNPNNAVCNCNGSLVNVNTKENKIFCGCPNGQLLSSNGTTCITVKACNETGWVVIDNYCVACVTGSTFNSTTKKCDCTTGKWRPNYCLVGTQTPFKSGSTFTVHNNGNNVVQDMCAKNDLVHTIPLNFSSSTSPQVRNILLSPEIAIFLESCFTTGTISATLKLNGTPVNFLTTFPGIACSGAIQKKYLAFQATESNVYTLEISCASATCSGDLILLTELKKVAYLSASSFLDLTNTVTNPDNRFKLGLNSIANQGIFWNMKKGDQIVTIVGIHGSEPKTFVLRISDTLQTTNELPISLTSTGYNYFNIKKDGDYYMTIGCNSDINCRGWLQLTVQKTNNGIAYSWEKEFVFTYNRTVNTANATGNTIDHGCNTSGEHDYLFKNLYRGDYIEVILNSNDSYVSFFNTDQNVNLEVQRVLDSTTLKYIFQNSIIAPGNYCLKFGCRSTITTCSDSPTVKVRKTLTSYLDGAAKTFGGSFTSTLQIGSGAGVLHDNFRNLYRNDSIYIETLPLNSTADYNNVTSLSMEGGGAIYGNIPALFNKFSKLYVPAANDGSYVVNLACTGGCQAKYLYSIYTFPTISGLVTNTCTPCSSQSIVIDNVCKTCSSLIAPDGFFYAPSDRSNFVSNDCSDYPDKYIYFNKVGKYYECKNGFTQNKTTTPHSCTCLGTLVNGECLPSCLASDGTSRVTSSELLRDSSGNCACSNVDKCYDQANNYTCINPVSGKIGNGNGKNCTNLCSDTTKCFDPTTFRCKNKIENSVEVFTTTVPGGQCVSNQCVVAGVQVSLFLISNPSFIKDANGNCQCSNTNLCLDSSTYTCIAGASGKINNKDGKVCSTSCTNSSNCFDSSTFTCRNKVENSVELFTSTSSGSVCIPNTCTITGTGATVLLNSNPSLVRSSNGECACSNINLCLNTDNNTCISGLSGKINNKDGKNCSSTACTDSTKCYDSTNFTCRSKVENSIEMFTSVSTGGVCVINTCTVASTGTIRTLNNNTFLVRASNGNCQCSNTGLCLDTTTNTCISGASGKVNNSNGNNCTTSCTDTAKCVDTSTFTCKNKVENSIEMFTSVTTGGNCVNNTCTISGTGTLRTLNNNTFLVRASNGNCQCSNINLCLDTTTNTCISGTSGKINNSNGNNCSASCTDPVKCIDTSNFTCRNKFENGLEVFTSVTNGGTCQPNSCLIDSTGTSLILTTNPSVIRNSNGKCICSDTDKCLNIATNSCIVGTSGKVNNLDRNVCTEFCSDLSFCYDPSTYVCKSKLVNGATFYSTTVAGGECISNICSLPTASITEPVNKLTFTMSIPEGTTNVKVEVTDPNGVLSSVNFNRYYLQVLFTDSYGDKIIQNSVSIEGLRASTNVASVTVTESQINEFCSYVDEAEPSRGRKCYFLAIIADKCNSTLDSIVYTHFAERTINGNYVIDDFAVARLELVVDYCRWVPSCFISTRYIFNMKTCQSLDAECTELPDNHKFRTGDTVYVQIEVLDINNLPVTGMTLSLFSAMTKLYTDEGVEIDTPERTIVILGDPFYVDNKVMFMFQVTPEILFYDQQTLISSNVRLIVIVNTDAQRMLRLLEIDAKPKEVIPQSGGLFALNYDQEDLITYLSLTDGKEEKKKNTVVIAVLCSVLGITLIIVAVLIYVYYGKNNKADANNGELKTDCKSACSVPENCNFKKVSTDFDTDRQNTGMQIKI